MRYVMQNQQEENKRGGQRERRNGSVYIVCVSGKNLKAEVLNEGPFACWIREVPFCSKMFGWCCRLGLILGSENKLARKRRKSRSEGVSRHATDIPLPGRWEKARLPGLGKNREEKERGET